MTMKKKSKSVPKFSTVAEESAYWDSHSLTEHLDEFKAVKMKLKGIPLKGYRLSKAGKLVKETKHLSVSAQLQKRGSKKVRVGKRI